MNKITKIIVGIVLLIVTCLVTVYIVRPSFFDRFLSTDVQKARTLKRVQKLFPEQIGAYKIFGEASDKVTITNICNKVEDNPILKETGRTGDACMETFVAEYRQPVGATTSMIRVNLSHFTRAPDMLRLLIEKSTVKDTLDGQTVFRLQSGGIAWKPVSDFDLIVIQEGLLVQVSTSTVTSKYLEFSTGTDDVTTYFISKYSPALLD